MKWFAPHVYCSAASIRTCFLILWTEVGNMLTQIRISAEQLSSTPPPPPCNTFLWTIYLPWSSTCLSGLGYSCTCSKQAFENSKLPHRTPYTVIILGDLSRMFWCRIKGYETWSFINIKIFSWGTCKKEIFHPKGHPRQRVFLNCLKRRKIAVWRILAQQLILKHNNHNHPFITHAEDI